ncbi:hypothetical protein [Brevibacterium litoralis]|uniref:hypothetical protein n=1 Tax=Brevibacterium litoralis TaxID=3138935 RepID=UPI0032EDB1F0
MDTMHHHPYPHRGTTGLRRGALTTGALALALGLAACAGGAGGAGDSGSGAAEGEGVEWGAGAEEYTAALADMEPVTLTYQAGGQGPNGFTGESELAYAERIKEWSGGKIELEMVWGQAISPFDQVTEAAADGRIDIGVEIPIYDPSKYPVVNELINLSPTKPTGPYLEEMVFNAAMQEVAWDTPEILAEYEDKGAYVQTPVNFEFANALMCTEDGASLADFGARQLRVGSSADLTIAESLGGTPVSMQFVEAYEALQRNTIDCTFGGLRIGADNGFLTVAPYAIFPSESSWVRNPTAQVLSQKVQDLPLAAQQLLFDLRPFSMANTIEGAIAFNGQAMDIIDETGGDVLRLDADAEAALDGAVEELRQKVVDSELVDGEDLVARFETAYEKYYGIAVDLGYPEIDDYRELAEVNADEKIEIDDFTAAVFEEIHLPRRPE